MFGICSQFNTHSYRSMRWMHTLLRVYGLILRLFTYMLYIILASFFLFLLFLQEKQAMITREPPMGKPLNWSDS